MIVTGAADSIITFWKDCTQEKERERQASRESAVLQYVCYCYLERMYHSLHVNREQDLLNYIAMKDYHNALVLALSLDQPGRLLSLFKQALSAPPLSDGEGAEDASRGAQTSLEAALRKLSPPEFMKLLKHIRDWNANAKTSIVAQAVLNSLLKLKTVDQIADAFNWNLKLDADAPVVPASDAGFTLTELVQALLPYTERHLARLDRLVQDSYIIDYVLKEMDGGLAEEDGMNIDF